MSQRIFLAALAAVLGCNVPAEPASDVEMEAPVRAETIDLGYAAFEVVHYGDAGPVVVMVPSLVRGADDFEDLGGRLAADGYHGVAINPRGIAGSTGVTTDLTLHDFGDDTIGIARAITSDPVHLVGHALGNRVVRAAATGHPEAVDTVTLLAAGGLVPIPGDVLMHLVRSFDLDLDDAERLESIRLAFFAEGNDPSVWLDGWWPEVAPGQSAAAMTPTEQWWQPPVDSVLIVQCIQDTIAVEENGRQLAGELGDNARLVELDGCGHAMLPEVPEELAGELLDYLPEP